MKKKAIIFDFDGVVTDGTPFHDEAYLELFRKFKIELSLEYLHTHIGLTPREVIQKISEEHFLTESLEKMIGVHHALLTDFYRNRATPSLGLPEFIRSAQQFQLLLGLASSTSSDILDFVLRKFELREAFHSLIGGESIQHGKPNPEMLIKILQRLNVTPEETFVIDDARSGIVAAKSINMFSVAYTYYNKNDIPEADLVVRNFLEIPLADL